MRISIYAYSYYQDAKMVSLNASPSSSVNEVFLRVFFLHSFTRPAIQSAFNYMNVSASNIHAIYIYIYKIHIIYCFL